MVNFGDFLKTRSLQSNSVTRQVTFNQTKIGRKCQNHYSRCFQIFRKNTHCSKNWSILRAFLKIRAENAKLGTFIMRHFGLFSNNVAQAYLRTGLAFTWLLLGVPASKPSSSSLFEMVVPSDLSPTDFDKWPRS